MFDCTVRSQDDSLSNLRDVLTERRTSLLWSQCGFLPTNTNAQASRPEIDALPITFAIAGTASGLRVRHKWQWNDIKKRQLSDPRDLPKCGPYVLARIGCSSPPRVKKLLRGPCTAEHSSLPTEHSVGGRAPSIRVVDESR